GDALPRLARADERRVAHRALPQHVDEVRRIARPINGRPAGKAAILRDGGDARQRVVAEVLEDRHAAQEVLHNVSPVFLFHASTRRWSIRRPTPMSRPMKPMVNMAMKRTGVETFM